MNIVFPATSIAQGLDHLAGHWHGSLAAIYGIRKPHAPIARQQVQGLGTGFFMACGAGVAFVTADHVIEPHLEERMSGLAMIVKGRPILLNRRFLRFPDADICACKFELHELAAAGISSIRPVPLVSDRTHQNRLGRYAAMGFPASWNVRDTRHDEGPSSLAIFGSGQVLPRSAKRPSEIALDFDPKRSSIGIPNKRHRGVPALNGMSGGPMFEVYWAERPDDNAIQFGVELAGVVVRRDPRNPRVIATAREHLFELLLRVATTL